jgi:hypothetical protein
MHPFGVKAFNAANFSQQAWNCVLGGFSQEGVQIAEAISIGLRSGE